MLEPRFVGAEHVRIANEVKALLAKYQALQDIISILGTDELSEDDRLVVHRARRLQRFLTQPFFSSEQFTGQPGRYVPISETLRGFDEILQGKTTTSRAGFPWWARSTTPSKSCHCERGGATRRGLSEAVIFAARCAGCRSWPMACWALWPGHAPLRVAGPGGSAMRRQECSVAVEGTVGSMQSAAC